MSDWTEDRIEDLKRLWAEGLSASAVARELGGCSRNAVLSKIHRLVLASRSPDKLTNPQRRIPSPQARRAPRPAQVRAPAPPPAPDPEPTGEAGAFVGNGRCKFIHGDVHGEWRMCGHETSSGTNPWCEHHERRVFNSQRASAA